jgi:hypothetical protein
MNEYGVLGFVTVLGKRSYQMLPSGAYPFSFRYSSLDEVLPHPSPTMLRCGKPEGSMPSRTMFGDVLLSSFGKQAIRCTAYNA